MSAGSRQLSHEASRRELTKKRLLEAAVPVIGRKGGMQARIEEICGAARVSRGTFYNYFNDMNEFYSCLWNMLTMAQTALIESALGEVEGNIERLRVAMACYLEKARRDTAWGWAMVNLAVDGLVESDDAFFSVQNMIERGMESGEFRISDVQAGCDIVVGACLTGMLTILKNPSGSASSSIVTEMLLRALNTSPDGLIKPAKAITTG